MHYHIINFKVQLCAHYHVCALDSSRPTFKKIYDIFHPIVIQQMGTRRISKDAVYVGDYEIRTGKYGPYITINKIIMLWCQTPPLEGKVTCIFIIIMIIVK